MKHTLQDGRFIALCGTENGKKGLQVLSILGQAQGLPCIVNVAQSVTKSPFLQNFRQAKHSIDRVPPPCWSDFVVFPKKLVSRVMTAHKSRADRSLRRGGRLTHRTMANLPDAQTPQKSNKNPFVPEKTQWSRPKNLLCSDLNVRVGWWNWTTR